jgi:TetR/AcrR family acrAB operon transcriptional repressor
MVGKTRAEAQATREQVLDAAERVFRERGVEAATLGEVAAAAGVTRGAVYWHFRDKADLLDALCQRARSPLEQIVADDGAAPGDDALGALRAMGIATLQHLARDPRAQAMFELVFQTCSASDKLAPLVSTQERERGACQRRVRQMIELAVKQGQLPADTDAALAAYAIHAYVLGLMQAWVHSPGAHDLAQAAPALIDTMLAGLKAAPPRRAARARGTALRRVAESPRAGCRRR